MSHVLRKTGALVATTALAAGGLSAGLVQPASAARVATDDTALDVASAWLKQELSNGLVVGSYDGTSYNDYGLTVDTGLALDEGGNAAAVEAIDTALQGKVADYVSGGSSDTVYAGAVAKLATFARAAGSNPTSYGGTNLVTMLEERVADTAPIAGRLQDKTPAGSTDTANVVGQSYAVRALALANSQETKQATDFLLAQQCASGAFRLDFAPAAAPAQGCVDGAPGSAADTDATALAVVNLLESGEKAKPVQDAVAKAATWLAAQQRANGSFGGGPTTTRANTNSTGLAGYALGLAKKREAATKAAVWVRKQQPVDKSRCRSALTRDLGAVAYNKLAIKAARTGGITEAATDQWRRATAQAALVLQWAPASPDALAVKSRLRAEAGDKIRVTVRGLAPGEWACVSVKGSFKRLKGKADGGPVKRKLVMPTGNRYRTIKVVTADSRAKTRIRVHN